MCEVSCLVLAMYINTERHIKTRASEAPPTVPSINARWFCPLCFFWGTIVTCGVSIGGLFDASSHMVVEKVRHRFPDILHKIKVLINVHNF